MRLTGIGLDEPGTRAALGFISRSGKAGTAKHVSKEVSFVGTAAAASDDKETDLKGLIGQGVSGIYSFQL